MELTVRQGLAWHTGRKAQGRIRGRGLRAAAGSRAGSQETQETSAAGDLDGPRAARETEGAHGPTGHAGPTAARVDGSARGLKDSAGARDEGVPGGHSGRRDEAGDSRRSGGRSVDGLRGFDDEGVRAASARTGGRGRTEPDVIQAARRERRAAAHGTRARRIRARKAPPQPAPEDDEEHFIPPAPPPLPKLDPIAKGAWAALFGGPGYLIVATAVGWSVPGIVAFCAVAAFVTGFAILVLRMNEPGPGGPDDGDDGAVV